MSQITLAAVLDWAMETASQRELAVLQAALGPLIEGTGHGRPERTPRRPSPSKRGSGSGGTSKAPSPPPHSKSGEKKEVKGSQQARPVSPKREAQPVAKPEVPPAPSLKGEDLKEVEGTGLLARHSKDDKIVILCARTRLDGNKIPLGDPPSFVWNTVPDGTPAFLAQIKGREDKGDAPWQTKWKQIQQSLATSWEKDLSELHEFSSFLQACHADYSAWVHSGGSEGPDPDTTPGRVCEVVLPNGRKLHNLGKAEAMRSLRTHSVRPFLPNGGKNQGA